MIGSKLRRVICLALVLIFVIPTNLSIGANASSGNLLAEDICIYSQWDYDIYNNDHDTSNFHFSISGCGWCALAHAIQILGFEPKDIEQPGYTPLPLQYFEETDYESSSGVGKSSEAIKHLKEKYPGLEAESPDKEQTLEKALKNGKVAVINYKNHFILASELVEIEDNKYVHIIDSCLTKSYNNIPNIYYKTETGSFKKIPGLNKKSERKEAYKDYISVKSTSWKCESLSSGRMTKEKEAQSIYGGGEYWVEYSYISKNATRSVYLSGNGYFSQCTMYPTNMDIKLKKSGTANVKSLPLGQDQAPAFGLVSETVEVGLNKTYTATALYKNSLNSYWYKVKTENGQTGFVHYGDIIDYEFRTDDVDIKLSDVIPPVIGNIFKKWFPSGIISSKFTGLMSVKVTIENSNRRNLFSIFSKVINILTGSSVRLEDNIGGISLENLNYNEPYRYEVTATVRSYYIDKNGQLQSHDETVKKLSSEFMKVDEDVEVPVSAQFVDVYVDEITPTAAGMNYRCNLTGCMNDKVSESGIKLYDRNGNSLGKTNVVAESYSGNYNYFYTKSKLHPITGLTANTTYQAQVYAIVDGKEFVSKIVTFKTPAEGETQTDEINAAYTVNISDVTSATASLSYRCDLPNNIYNSAVSRIGLYLYDGEGEELGEIYTDSTPDLSGRYTYFFDNNIPIDYLEPDTDYSVRVYSVVNGKVALSEYTNFKTNPLITDTDYFEYTKEPVDDYMIVMGGDAKLYMTPNASSSVAQITVKDPSTYDRTGEVPQYFVVYADYVGKNASGEEFYHLANMRGFVCDILEDTYVKSELISPLVVGKYKVNMSASSSLSVTENSDGTGDSMRWNTGTSFYYTGDQIWYDETTGSSLGGARGSVRNDSFTGWAYIGYFKYDASHVHTFSAYTADDKYSHSRICTDCGYEEVEDHTVVEDKGTAASCTEPGLTDGAHCSVCGEILTEQDEIPATGHQHTEVRGAVEATADHDGYTGDTYCTDCETLLSKGSVIPKLAPAATEASLQIYGSSFTIDAKRKLNIFRTKYVTGTEHTVVYTGNDFLYWTDITGMVLSESLEYTFTFMNTTTLFAVTKNSESGIASVLILTGSGAGQIAVADSVTSDEVTTLEMPAVGDFPGFVFSGWTVIDIDNNAENTITSGDNSEVYGCMAGLIDSGVKNIAVKPYFEVANANEIHTVTVIYDSNGTTSSKQYSVAGDRVKVYTADETYLGQAFAGWYIGDKMVCPNRKYVTLVDKDITVRVKYSNSDTVVSGPVVENVSYTADSSTGTNKVVHLTLHNVPDEYEVIGYGTIYSVSVSSPSDLIIENVDGSAVRKIEKSGAQYGIMTSNITVGSSVSTVVHVRGYVTVRYEGNVTTYYTEILSESFNSLNNAGGNDSGGGEI